MLKQLFILAVVCLTGLCGKCDGLAIKPGEHLCGDCGDKHLLLREGERLAACSCPHMQGHVPITDPLPTETEVQV